MRRLVSIVAFTLWGCVGTPEQPPEVVTAARYPPSRQGSDAPARPPGRLTVSASTEATSPPAEADARVEPARAAPSPSLPELFAREVEALPRHRWSASDGAWSMEVEGSAAPERVEGHGDPFSIPLDTRVTVECVAHRKRVDVASVVSWLARDLGRRHRLSGVRVVDLAVSRGAPVLFAEIEYSAPDDAPGTAGSGVGLLKIAVHPGDALSLVCLHDELGYRATFRRLILGLTGSLSVRDAGAEPPKRFSEVQAVRLNGEVVGFSERAVFASQDSSRVRVVNAMLLSRSAIDLVASDSVTVEEADAKGALEQVEYSKLLNGEVDAQVKLTRTAAGYAYAGTWEGKRISGAFEAKAPLLGDLGQWRLVRAAIVAGKKPALTVATYSPSTDPTASLEVVYRRRKAVDRGVDVELGPLRFQGTADEHGVLAHTTLTLGRIVVNADRIHAAGVP